MIKKIGIPLILFMSDGVMIYLFHLKNWSVLCPIIVSILCILVFWIMDKENQKTKERFYEISDYMEQFLYSRQRYSHVQVAEEGDMTIHKKNDISILYNSRKLYFMYCLVSCLEQIDSDAGFVIDILQKELQMWKQRALLYYKKKCTLGKEVFLACMLAILLCFVTRWIFPFNIVDELENIAIYHGSTLVVYTGTLLLSVCALHNFNFICPDSRKESAESIEEQFFYWLLSVSLYFQHGSMYHAIQKSGTEWDGDFQEEIQKLLERIYELPESPLPYEEFFGDKDLPQIHIGMKLLYSLSRSDDQDARKKMILFVEQNLWRLDQIEADRYQSSLSRVQLIRQIPMVLAGSKIVFDSLVFVWIMAHETGVI